MVPNKDLLRGTPLSAGKAILVDEHCRTNVPDIYAAGDCASIYDPLFGKHRLLDHWENARVTGELAGRNMAGRNESFSYVGHFTTDIFGLRAAAWGEPRLVDRRIMRGVANVDSPNFLEIGVDGQGRIAHVLAVGHESEDEVLRRLVQNRTVVEGREEQLKDPSTDLGAV
jgi:3-phenylpropionate/trans-cinnamate dioxygenase ferredoxin reductase component